MKRLLTMFSLVLICSCFQNRELAEVNSETTMWEIHELVDPEFQAFTSKIKAVRTKFEKEIKAEDRATVQAWIDEFNYKLKEIYVPEKYLEKMPPEELLKIKTLQKWNQSRIFAGKGMITPSSGLNPDLANTVEHLYQTYGSTISEYSQNWQKELYRYLKKLEQLKAKAFNETYKPPKLSKRDQFDERAVIKFLCIEPN